MKLLSLISYADELPVILTVVNKVKNNKKKAGGGKTRSFPPVVPGQKDLNTRASDDFKNKQKMTAFKGLTQ